MSNALAKASCSSSVAGNGRVPLARAVALLVLCTLVTRVAAQDIATAAAQFNPAIENASNAIGTRLHQWVAPPPCEKNRACGATAIPALALVDFANPIPELYDRVQVKVYDTNGTLSAADADELCRIQSMNLTWGQALDVLRPGLLHQYFASSTQNFGVYPPLAWNCSAPYTPRERPYYIEGATGPKNVAILIDVSGLDANSAERLALSKAAAKTLLGALGSRDFVTVIPYSRSASPVLDGLIAVNPTTRAIMTAAIDALAISEGVGANVGQALRAAHHSWTRIKGSGCSGVVVLLSSGRDDITTLLPEGVLDSTGLVVFSHLHVPGNVNRTLQRDRLLRGIACRSGALLAVSTTEAEASAAVTNIVHYMANMVPQEVTRWSLPYLDAFGHGRILSAVRPISIDGRFRGITVLDVTVDKITSDARNVFAAAVTEADVAMWVRGQSTCTPLEPSHHTVAGTLQFLQQGTCDNNTMFQRDPITLERNRWLLIFISMLVPTCLLLVPFIIVMRRNTNVGFSYRVALLSYIGLWFLALIVFWVLVFDDLVLLRTYTEVEYTVNNAVGTPRRCCERTNCVCAEAAASTTTPCDDLLLNLAEGQCRNGFRCCEQECEECLCKWDNISIADRCSTCCSCSQAVANETCHVSCGTCNTVTADVEYVFEGQTYTAQFVDECGRDDTDCVTRFSAEHRIGGRYQAWINPDDRRELRRKVGFDPAFALTCIIAASITIVAYAALVYLAYFGDLMKAEKIKRRKKYTAEEQSLNKSGRAS